MGCSKREIAGQEEGREKSEKGKLKEKKRRIGREDHDGD